MGTLSRTVSRSHLKDTAKIIPMILSCSFAREIAKGVEDECLKCVERQMEVNFELLKHNILTEFFAELKAIDDDEFDNLTFWSPLEAEGAHKYNLYLKSDHDSNNQLLDVSKISVGITFKGYHSFYARSIVHHNFQRDRIPEKFIMLVYGKVLECLKDGVELCKVYKDAHLFAEKKDINLAKYLQEEFGFQVSPNFNNPRVAIVSDAKAVAKADMFFAVTINLINIKERGVTFSLHFCDTVQIRKDRPAYVLTDFDHHFITLFLPMNCTYCLKINYPRYFIYFK